MVQMDTTESFHDFILISNKCIRSFSIFSSGFWTSLDFSFFASTGGLRRNFLEFKVHSQASTRVCENDKHPSVNLPSQS